MVPVAGEPTLSLLMQTGPLVFLHLSPSYSSFRLPLKSMATKDQRSPPSRIFFVVRVSRLGIYVFSVCKGKFGEVERLTVMVVEMVVWVGR
jgi:hypothetical protein